jgi:hypothetical protein
VGIDDGVDEVEARAERAGLGSKDVGAGGEAHREPLADVTVLA